jgi:hypothetical protein
MLNLWGWLGILFLALPLAAVMVGFFIAHIIDTCTERKHRLCHCVCCIHEYEFL